MPPFLHHLPTMPITMRSKIRTSHLLPTAVLLCGCEGIQSTLAPRGPNALVIANISWVMFWGAAAILLLVMALALYAVYRAPDKRPAWPGNRIVLAGGVIFPVVTLTALLVYGVTAMGTLRADQRAVQDGTLHIEVVGNQWWWEVRYGGGDGRPLAVTANEIRIPVSVPVSVAVRTNDVIHSFWVPNLAGKIDLIPGRTNRIVLQADRPGIFRGQCAEFCGAQHAHMAFLVVAEPADDYNAWLERQRMPAAVGGDRAVLHGRDAFVANNCIACHTVRGLGTASGRGPDLTHVASRLTLAAGTLQNTPANMAAFIARSQEIKPGSKMPSHPHLDDATLQSLAAFLGSLQ
jgi:cytochrome c oxidase subunit 2